MCLLYMAFLIWLFLIWSLINQCLIAAPPAECATASHKVCKLYPNYGVHHIAHYWIDSLSIQQMWPFLNLQTSIKTLCITLYFLFKVLLKLLTKSLTYILWNYLDHIYCCDVQFVWVIFLGSQIIRLKQI